MKLIYTVTFFLLISVTYAKESVVYVLGTGGTIAGTSESAANYNYSPSILTTDYLVANLPDVHTLPAIKAEQLFQISSQDFTPNHWLILAKSVPEFLSYLIRLTSK